MPPPRFGFSPNGGHIARALVCAIALIALLLSYDSNLASGQSGGGGTPTPEPTPTWNVTWKSGSNDLAVFVISTPVDGDFGGLSGMKTECETRATLAGLTGEWYPLASDDTWDANSVTGTTGTRNIRNMKGEIVAHSLDRFWAAAPTPYAHQLAYTENKTYVGNLDEDNSTYVWSGSYDDGTKITGDNCNGWTDGSGTYTNTFGAQWKRDYGMFNGVATQYCSGNHRIYCIGVSPATPTPTPTWNVSWKDTTTDLMIFVNPTPFSGAAGGLEGMRTSCQAVATTNGYSGSWYPIVSASTWDTNKLTGTTNNTRNIYNNNRQVVATTETELWSTNDGYPSLAYALNYTLNC